MKQCIEIEVNDFDMLFLLNKATKEDNSKTHKIIWKCNDVKLYDAVRVFFITSSLPKELLEKFEYQICNTKSS